MQPETMTRFHDQFSFGGHNIDDGERTKAMVKTMVFSP